MFLRVHSRRWTVLVLTVGLAVALAVPVFAQTAPATAKDPVCGMTVKTAGAKYTSTHQGRTYYFCSETCKKTFDKEPARYAERQQAAPPVTAKDPVCGMTVKTADAKFTSVHDGTTYYFCSETCKKTFDKEPAKYVKK